MGRLALIVWIGLCLGLAATPRVRAETAAMEMPRSAFVHWREATAAYFANQDNGGLMPSSTYLPFAARVWFERDGAREECSGVLVSRLKVLTAAHCVCGQKPMSFWFAPDQPRCSALARTLKGRVFMATEGFLDVVNVEIHPAYRHPLTIADRSATGSADLALLTLSRPVASPALAIAAPRNDRRYLVAGFGRLSVLEPFGPLAPGVTYQAGAPQISRFPPARLEDGDCGDDALRDTFCSARTPLNARVDKNKSGGACEGTSGAGVYDTADGKPSLVGIIAFIAPYSACEERTSSFNYAVNLAHYRAWILERAPEGALASDRVCADRPMGQGQARLILDGGLDLVSVTVIGDLDRGVARPAYAIEGVDEAQCAFDRVAGSAACRLDAKDRAIIEIEQGAFGYATICWGARS